MSVYLDACVLVPLIIPEDATTRVRTFLGDVSQPIYVSDLGIAEVAAAISRHVRAKIVTATNANAALAYFDDWIAKVATVLPIEPADVRRASAMVRQFELKLLTPDAIHLALAERYGLKLVTLDKRLAEAAGGLGVEYVEP